jgi:hypothetical protein
VNTIILVARRKIATQFNEIMPALSIFEKHWPFLDDANRAAIFKYLKLLIALCEKEELSRKKEESEQNGRPLWF